MISPRLVCIQHSNEYLEDCKRIIDDLPPNSKVGLEMTYGHPEMQRVYPRYTRLILEEERPFYLALADYAHEKGHFVKWLEKPNSSVHWKYFNILENQTNSLEYSLEKMAYSQGFDRTKAKVKHFLRSVIATTAEAIILPLSAINALSRSKWRTRMMARHLLLAGWRPTDVAFVGGYHGPILQEEYGIPTWKKIPEETPLDIRLIQIPVNTALNALEKASDLARKAKKWFYARKQK